MASGPRATSTRRAGGATGISSNVSGICQINTTVDAYNVCLGPGHLCDGGVYVSGHGSHVLCKYEVNWSPYVLLLILAFLVISFDRLRKLIEKQVPHEYRPVLHAFFAELAELGFVSLLAFVLERAWDEKGSVLDQIGGSLGLGHTLHTNFEYLHFLLFGISVVFVLMTLILLRFNLRQFQRYQTWSVQIEEGVDVLHQMPKIGSVSLPRMWMWPRKLLEEREFFLRLYERFIDVKLVMPGDIPIPASFNLGKYFMLRSSEMMSHVLHINLSDWCIIVTLSLIPFVAFYYSAGKDPENSPDAGYIFFWIYNITLWLSTLLVDWKLHHVIMKLVPLELEEAGTLTRDFSSKELDASEFLREDENGTAADPPNPPRANPASGPDPPPTATAGGVGMEHVVVELPDREPAARSRTSSDLIGAGGEGGVAEKHGKGVGVRELEGAEGEGEAVREFEGTNCAPERESNSAAPEEVGGDVESQRQTSDPNENGEARGEEGSDTIPVPMSGRGYAPMSHDAIGAMLEAMYSEGEGGEERAMQLLEAIEEETPSAMGSFRLSSDIRQSLERLSLSRARSSIERRKSGDTGCGGGEDVSILDGFDYAKKQDMIKEEECVGGSNDAVRSAADAEANVESPGGGSTADAPESAREDEERVGAESVAVAVEGKSTNDTSGQGRKHAHKDGGCIEISLLPGARGGGGGKAPSPNPEERKEPAPVDDGERALAEAVSGVTQGTEAASGDAATDTRTQSERPEDTVSISGQSFGTRAGYADNQRKRDLIEPRSCVQVVVEGSEGGVGAERAGAVHGYGRSGRGTDQHHIPGFNYGTRDVEGGPGPYSVVGKSFGTSTPTRDGEGGKKGRVAFLSPPPELGRSPSFIFRGEPAPLRRGARVSFEMTRQKSFLEDEVMRDRFLPAYVRHHHTLVGRSWLQKRLGGRVINAQQSLFWFGSHGPAFLVTIIRLLTVSNVVMVTCALESYRNLMLCTGVSINGACGQVTGAGVVVLVVALAFPLSCFLMLPNIIRNFVIATNVELLKNRQTIMKVLHKTRNQRTMRLCRTLLSLGSVIDHIRNLAYLAKEVREEGRASGDFARRSNDFVRRSLEFLANRASSERELAATYPSGGEGGQRGKSAARRSVEAVRGSMERMKTTLQAKTSSLDRAVAVMDKTTLENLRELFKEVDSEGTGFLDKARLAELLEATGAYCDAETVDTLFEIMDVQRNGVVSFQAFVAVFHSERKRQPNPMELAIKVWEMFDPKETGKITLSGIESTIHRVRPNFDCTDIVKLIRHVDTDNNGYVERARFQEFVIDVFRQQKMDI